MGTLSGYGGYHLLRGAEYAGGWPVCQVYPCLYPFDYGNDQGKGRERYEQYTAAMLEVARLKAVPVLDMYHHGLMNPCIPAIKALRMPDGAHMTLAGLELYTAQIIGFLRQVGALGD